MDGATIPDTGEFEVPVGGLESKEEEPESEELRLERWSRVAPAGAITGSEVRVRIENRLDVVVAATGPL